jgi:hypothetical protein
LALGLIVKFNHTADSIAFSHQANSGDWQQTLTIYSNNNRGIKTQQSTNDFDGIL